MANILITGGTGLVGTALTKQLTAKGHHVVILSRSARSSSQQNVSYAQWDVDKQTIDDSAVAKADFIVHLAGAGVAEKRWSEVRKKEIQESRTKSSQLIIAALQRVQNNVQAVISASAIGWYGPDKNKQQHSKPFTEDRPAFPGFLGDTCKLWEQSITPVQQLGKRLVIYRFGIVLSNDGGALAEFKKPLGAGIAAMLGGGKQVVSWIHIDDACRLIVYAIEHNISGTYNAVAPQPVTNKELTLELAQRMRGRFFVPLHVPAFVIKLMLGELSIEVLKSTTVSADKIRNEGFQFLYPTIGSALDQLVKQDKGNA
jgi:uncharacterized protein